MPRVYPDSRTKHDQDDQLGINDADSEFGAADISDSIHVPTFSISQVIPGHGRPGGTNPPFLLHPDEVEDFGEGEFLSEDEFIERDDENPRFQERGYDKSQNAFDTGGLELDASRSPVNAAQHDINKIVNFQLDDSGNLVNGAKHQQKPLPGTSTHPAFDENEISDDEFADFAGDDDEDDLLNLSQHAKVGALGAVLADPEFEQRLKKLTETIQTLKSRVGNLKKQNKEIESERKQLRENLIRLETEKDEAELKAEREMRMLQYKTLGGGKNPVGNRAAEIEAQKKREEARRAMYSGDQEEDTLGFGDVGDINLGYFAPIYRKINKFVRQHYPLSTDLRRVDARFGSSVASYFFFFRWMIINYMVIGTICVCFLVKHIFKLLAYQELTEESRQKTWNSASSQFEYYKWTADHWSRLSGFLPKFLMYSSFNPGDTSTLFLDETTIGESGTLGTFSKDLLQANGSSPVLNHYSNFRNEQYGERLDYVLLLIICNVCIVFATVRKWISEDRKAQSFEVFEEADGQNKYAKMTLNLWDHSLKKKRQVEDMKYATIEGFKLALHEERTLNLNKSRTLKERSILFARRAFANLLYIGIQATSAGVIIVMTVFSASMREQILDVIRTDPNLAWASSFADLIAGSIVPLVVSVINSITPIFFKQLTNLEKWDDQGYHTKLMLFRLFVAKNLNVLIQIFSFVQLLDPYLMRGTQYLYLSEQVSLTTRVSTEKRFQIRGSDYVASNSLPSGMDECRGDWYGFGVFQLVLTDFVVSKIGAITGPIIAKVIARIRKKPWIRAEFEVAKEMVDLLFFQQLCFMSFPFFPFGSIIIVMMAVSNFKFNKWTLEKFMQKPKKPWGAKDAANFFIKFFFITYVISGAVTVYILNNSTFPKACQLQEVVSNNLYTSQGTTKYPLETCFQIAGAERCLMESRMKQDIEQNTNSDSGIEELRFWEEYFLLKNTSSMVHQLTSTDTVPVDALLREATGFTSSTAVRNSTLMVCSLACGPFVFNTKAYQPIDRLLTANIYSIYNMVAANALFVWTVAIIVLLMYFFKANRLAVVQDLQLEKEISLRNVIMTLEGKVKKLTQSLEKVKKA